MKIRVIAVGKVRGSLAEPVAEYESRVRHYYGFDAVEVKEVTARRGMDVGRVREEEGERLLARVPSGWEVVAVHPGGDHWSSERLSRYLSDCAVQSVPGVAFLVGGAEGLSEEVLRSARHLLSLSAFMLPHELARLVLTEQLYRAGTIIRGEPYHKA